MIPEPLHPALVHFPIALAILLPFGVLAALFVIRRGARPRPVWAGLVIAAAILFGSAFASVKTGEAQEELVEDVLASEQPLHDHEESAERFLILAGVVLALSPLGLLSGRAGSAGRAAMAVGSVALFAAIWPVGESGGDLVYRHGAAQAHVMSGSMNVGSATPEAARTSRRDGGRTDR
jgi:uncharacterized membrane protein